MCRCRGRVDVPGFFVSRIARRWPTFVATTWTGRLLAQRLLNASSLDDPRKGTLGDHYYDGAYNPQPHGLPLHVHSIPATQENAAMTMNDLSAALHNFSSRASTPVASVCCCGRNDCESLLEWQETRARLEKGLVLSAVYLLISVILVYRQFTTYFRSRLRTVSSP